MDISEYNYYSDLIGYIAENDQSENAQLLLRNSRYHLKKLSKLIDRDRDLNALKTEIHRYKYHNRTKVAKVKNSCGKLVDSFVIVEPENIITIPSIKVKSTEKETGIRFSSDQKYSNVNIMDLL